MVDQALLVVFHLASRPPYVLDPYAPTEALEHLEDVARPAGHANVRKFTPSPTLEDLETHTLGNDIEKEVAKTVAKMCKPSVLLSLTPRDGGAVYPRPIQDWLYPRGGGRQPLTARNFRCFKCCHLG